MAFDAYLIGDGISEGNVPLSIPAGGTASSGINTAIQKFIIEMLTAKGSNKADAQQGTAFAGRLLAGTYKSDVEVLSAFNSESFGVVTKLRRRNPNALPTEQISSVKALAATVLPGEVSIFAQLTTDSGATQQLTLPATLSL